MKGWKIEIYRGKGSQPWRWRLRAPNNKFTAIAGEGFARRPGLINNIVRVQFGIGAAHLVDLTGRVKGRKP